MNQLDAVVFIVTNKIGLVNTCVPDQKTSHIGGRLVVVGSSGHFLWHERLAFIVFTDGDYFQAKVGEDGEQ